MSLAVKDDGSAADLRLVHLPLDTFQILTRRETTKKTLAKRERLLLFVTLRCLLAEWFQALLHVVP
jgi:hypothetical protein